MDPEQDAIGGVPPDGMNRANPPRRIVDDEPIIRIGVLLSIDEVDALDLVTPDQPVGLFGVADGARAIELAPRTALHVHRVGHLVVLDALANSAVPASAPLRPVQSLAGPVLRLIPVGPQPLARGVGVQVRGIPAGRGFHWQKRMDQTLAGTLELRVGEQGLVLISELPLEYYLAGVITAEMSSVCPLEFLKAQCIVARSWLLARTEAKHAGAPFDRCNDDCCQRYQGTGDLSPSALAAVRDTRGRVLLAPDGGVLDANYSKCCGGVSETPWAVWGLDKPGLNPIVDAPPGADASRFFPVTDANLDEYLDGAWLNDTPCYCSPNAVPPEDISRYLGRVDTAGEYFRWTVRYERGELEALLREKLGDADELAELRDLRVRARGASGRAYAIETEWRDAHGGTLRRRIDTEYRIRQVLHRKFLFSSAFSVRPEHDATGALRSVVLRGAGWGHGVGLCQIGALGMALAGCASDEICAHYYPQAALADLYG